MVLWSEPEHTGDATPDSEKATCFHRFASNVKWVSDSSGLFCKIHCQRREESAERTDSKHAGESS